MFSAPFPVEQVKCLIAHPDMGRGLPAGVWPEVQTVFAEIEQLSALFKRHTPRFVITKYCFSYCHIIMRVKMKELHRIGVEWDQPLKGDIRASRLEMFEMLVLVRGIRFRRCTKLVCYFF